MRKGSLGTIDDRSAKCSFAGGKETLSRGFVHRARAHTASILFTLLVIGSAQVVSQTPGHAEVSNGQGTLAPGIVTLANRTLVASQFFVNNSDLAIQAQCSTAGCQATAPAFTPMITCPGPVNQTCTFYVQVAAQVSVTPGDFGEYRLLVDGVPPIHFQTDFSGYFNWVQQDPNSGLGVWEARSYAVVATVINRIVNQAHKVEVDIACYDVTADGCIGAIGFGDLRVDVFRP